MDLETIVQMYGWTDYMDMNSGYIYHLSDIMVTLQRDTNASEIKVPVTENGALIGYARMRNVA